MKVRVTLYANNIIDKHLVAVAKDAGKLQNKLHSLGVSILKVWHDTPKAKLEEANEVAVARINALQGASPYHQAAIAKWVGMYTPFVWNKEEKVWVSHSTNNQLMGKDFMAARDNPFWTVSPPPQPKPMDLFAEVEKLIQKATKHREKPVEGDVINPSAVTALREVLAFRQAA